MFIDGDIIHLKLLNELSPVELKLFLYLNWKKEYKTNIVYTTYEIIMRDVDIRSKDTLRKYLNSLEEKGYIDRIKKPINGWMTTDSYRILVNIEAQLNLQAKLDDLELKKIINDYTENEELRKALLNYVDMRKANKPINSMGEMESLLRTLNRLASSNTEKIEILDYSTQGHYSKLYKPSKDKTSNKFDNDVIDYTPTTRNRRI